MALSNYSELQAANFKYRGKTRFERFMEKVSPEPNSGCWLWTGSINQDGYGNFGMGNNRSDKAHRVAYRFFCEDIPDGMVVMHKCDVPSCVNPDHLKLGTQLDNVRDRYEKGRCAKGASNGNVVLTEELARIIKASPLTRRKLSEKLGIHISTIQAVCDGRVWRHV